MRQKPEKRAKKVKPQITYPIKIQVCKTKLNLRSLNFCFDSTTLSYEAYGRKP